MKREITRTKQSRYCTVRIELEADRLSITGEEGRIVTNRAARKQALAYWTAYFADERGAIQEMNERCKTRFTSARGAARYVLENDGEFHGLDATETADGKVRLLESCGCIHESVAKWFPEVAPLLPWHLNDMKAGCEHQEALGWGPGHTVALTRQDLTPAQRQTIEADRAKAYNAKIEKLFAENWALLLKTERALHQTMRQALNRAHLSISDVEEMHAGKNAYGREYPIVKQVKEFVLAEMKRHNPQLPFDHAVYPDSLCAPCPVCGYKYGTAWLKRELPTEIVALAETVAA